MVGLRSLRRISRPGGPGLPERAVQPPLATVASDCGCRGFKGGPTGTGQRESPRHCHRGHPNRLNPTPAQEICVGTDVEPDGPIPGPRSLPSFASRAYRADKSLAMALMKSGYREATKQNMPKAWFCNLWRELQRASSGWPLHSPGTGTQAGRTPSR